MERPRHRRGGPRKACPAGEEIDRRLNYLEESLRWICFLLPPWFRRPQTRFSQAAIMFVPAVEAAVNGPRPVRTSRSSDHAWQNGRRDEGREPTADDGTGLPLLRTAIADRHFRTDRQRILSRMLRFCPARRKTTKHQTAAGRCSDEPTPRAYDGPNAAEAGSLTFLKASKWQSG